MVLQLSPETHATSNKKSRKLNREYLKLKKNGVGTKNFNIDFVSKVQSFFLLLLLVNPGTFQCCSGDGKLEEFRAAKEHFRDYLININLSEETEADNVEEEEGIFYVLGNNIESNTHDDF
ncbi:hypothetical protein L1887_10766 [Cichorium endivia]|nr:hypothetical protein L1887_10766 [Cichorium endivia]